MSTITAFLLILITSMVVIDAVAENSEGIQLARYLNKTSKVKLGVS